MDINLIKMNRKVTNEEITENLPRSYQIFYKLCLEAGLKIIDEDGEKINLKISSKKENENDNAGENK